MSDIEKLRLNTIAGEISYTDGVQEHVNGFAAKILKRFLAGGQILELGPAEGVMTAELLKFDLDLTVVEGSSTLSRALEDKFPKLNVINALFEDFDPKEQYGTIVLSHVLEHVENPIDILAKIGTWVAPNGIIFAAVPNALSLHRRAGVLMGLIDKEDTLNDQDISIGYRRVYTPELLHAHFRQANLK